MSKRKLTRQQAWRIAKVQEERAQRAARKGATADEALSAGALGPEREGLIVAHFGTQVMVESAPNESQRCHIRSNIDALVTGDRVIWCEGEPTGVVVARLDRDSALFRPDSQGKLKPVAANIDQIIIVLAPLPEPHANLIDRYLVAAETVGIEPVILLNKTDILDQDPRVEEKIGAMFDTYGALGYQLLRASSKSSDGMDSLLDALAKKTSVFVGQSGVGKSSLVNLLLPDSDLRVGPLSDYNQKGMHTTTTAQLFHMPCGGALIDSPGIREFGLWHMTREQVEFGFREFRPILGNCKFRNCIHEHEPGCALMAASEAGEISAGRIASYRHMIDGLNDIDGFNSQG